MMIRTGMNGRGAAAKLAIAGGITAIMVGPLAGAASAATTYPPKDNCATTVSGTATNSVTASSANCAGTDAKTVSKNTPATTTSSNDASLAFTGTDTPVLAGLGALMVIGGAVITVQGRRRRS